MAPRLSDHRLREINANDVGTSARGRCGEIAGTWRNVQKADAGADIECVKQGAVGLRGQVAEIRVVRLRDLLPASVFESAELILFHDSLFTFRRAVAKRCLVSMLSSVNRKVKIQLSVERTATRVVSPRRSLQATCLIDQRKRHIEVR
jgi:hypothetical protein